MRVYIVLLFFYLNYIFFGNREVKVFFCFIISMVFILIVFDYDKIIIFVFCFCYYNVKEVCMVMIDV